MIHWVSRAHALGPSAATPVNRVLLALFYCSPGMLRDPLNRPIPTGLHGPARPLTDGKDFQLYQLMLQELDDTERYVAVREAVASLPPFRVSRFESVTFRFVLSGCRALVLAQCGWREEALEAAQRGLVLAKERDEAAGPVYWIMPLALSYCGLVGRSLGHDSLAVEAVAIMRRYAPRFPLTLRMIDILTDQPLRD
jgi:hypothetical protein